MNKFVLYALGLLVAVVAQVLLFGNLSVWGGVAFVYLIPLIKTPPKTNRLLQIVIGFVVGILVDVCFNTHGMHAFVGCTTMFFRYALFTLIVGKDMREKDVNITDLGFAPFARFSLTLIAMHSVLIYLIEAFTFFNIGMIFVKIVISILLTWLFAIIWELATKKR